MSDGGSAARGNGPRLRIACRRIACLLPILLGACKSTDADTRRVSRLGERLVHEIRWDTLYTIGGSATDSTLLLPRLITARAGTLYAYDYGARRLKAFDRDGRLRWAFGRKGSGPGEFANPTHVVATGDAVWVTDAGAGRITVVTGDGELREHIGFDGRLFLRLLPRGEHRLVFPTSPDELWLLLGRDGKVIEAGPLPTQPLRAANPAIRAPFVGISPGGRTWAMAFFAATPLLVYEDVRPRCSGNLIEGSPEFPAEYRPGSPVWALDLALSDTTALVLARGQTASERRLVDEYSLRDCRYLRRLLLPRIMQSMAYDGDVFYFYHEEPAPTILALRPRVTQSSEPLAAQRLSARRSLAPAPSASSTSPTSAAHASSGARRSSDRGCREPCPRR